MTRQRGAAHRSVITTPACTTASVATTTAAAHSATATRRRVGREIFQTFALEKEKQTSLPQCSTVTCVCVCARTRERVLYLLLSTIRF